MSNVRARPKHYTFKTSLTWDAGLRATQRCAGKPDIAVATPVEFKGPGDAWSPEELQIAALESCILLTFLYMAGRQGIELVSYASEAEGRLELSPEGMQFTEFVVRPKVVIAPGGDAGAARKAVERAAESCLVHRSLRSQVRVEAEVTAAPA